jgi:hypothetical protein
MRAFPGMFPAATVLVAAAILQLAGAAVRGVSFDAEELEGLAERGPVSHRPTVQAAFASESYRPGSTATLVSFDSASHVAIALFRVGDAVGPLDRIDLMRGTPYGHVHKVRRLSRGQRIGLRLRRWPSGLYYAQLTAAGGRVGYAPFVLAPRRLGTSRVAVVLPTQTWQAYNYRDGDGDGTGDTWYASPETIATARLHRPFENRGVPLHYRHYDEPFLRWLARSGYRVDFLSDRELKQASGEGLAAAYRLLVFPGHHEYVTEHEYDAVTRFRDLGGNLMFLSANNFFYKVTIAGHVMTRLRQWRNLGRPESALVGIEYFAGVPEKRGARPWTLRSTEAGRWVFAGTGLSSGSRFGSGGIEVDAVDGASPPRIQVLAVIRNVVGDGRAAQMTLYEAPSGARVFAAGAFSLASCVWQPPIRKALANLIRELSKPPAGPAL